MDDIHHQFFWSQVPWANWVPGWTEPWDPVLSDTPQLSWVPHLRPDTGDTRGNPRRTFSVFHGKRWENMGNIFEHMWNIIQNWEMFYDFLLPYLMHVEKKWYVLLDVDEYSGHLDQDPTQRHRHRLVTTCYDLPKSILSGEKKQHGELSVLFVGQKILGWWILWNHVPH